MKRLLSRLLLTAMVGATVGVIGGGQAAQAAINCPPNIVDTTVHADVNVPAGTCTIQNSTITGKVTVQPGANLIILGSTIGGSVTAIKPASFRVDALLPCTVAGDPTSCVRITRIGGDFTADGATSVPAGFAANTICNGTRITGDLTITRSGRAAPPAVGLCAFGGNVIGGWTEFTRNVPYSAFGNNRVGGSGEFVDNTGGGEVTKSKFGGSLLVDNDPPCWTVSGNTAPGGQTVIC
jgi:hypothetical protein